MPSGRSGRAKDKSLPCLASDSILNPQLPLQYTNDGKSLLKKLTNNQINTTLGPATSTKRRPGKDHNRTQEKCSEKNCIQGEKSFINESLAIEGKADNQEEPLFMVNKTSSGSLLEREKGKYTSADKQGQMSSAQSSANVWVCENNIISKKSDVHPGDFEHKETGRRKENKRSAKKDGEREVIRISGRSDEGNHEDYHNGSISDSGRSSLSSGEPVSSTRPEVEEDEGEAEEGEEAEEVERESKINPIIQKRDQRAKALDSTQAQNEKNGTIRHDLIKPVARLNKNWVPSVSGSKIGDHEVNSTLNYSRSGRGTAKECNRDKREKDSVYLSEAKQEHSRLTGNINTSDIESDKWMEKCSTSMKENTATLRPNCQKEMSRIDTVMPGQLVSVVMVFHAKRAKGTHPLNVADTWQETISPLQPSDTSSEATVVAGEITNSEESCQFRCQKPNKRGKLQDTEENNVNSSLKKEETVSIVSEFYFYPINYCTCF
ncbi:unnamed protein product [Protopolystoma xenopodis]|uniref:Uncharacterized protein n=1 Tax=Protopolystoma xenopodis TaxID=117903 RepID=A0A448WUC8_9PLAT|nr:unnamed protein product [Protopolystoma xenopodis]